MNWYNLWVLKKSPSFPTNCEANPIVLENNNVNTLDYRIGNSRPGSVAPRPLDTASRLFGSYRQQMPSDEQVSSALS